MAEQMLATKSPFRNLALFQILQHCPAVILQGTQKLTRSHRANSSNNRRKILYTSSNIQNWRIQAEGSCLIANQHAKSRCTFQSST